MKSLTLAVLFCACLWQFSLAQTPDDHAAIHAIMEQQTRCWNEGNLPCFMEGYWHSDSLMFVGKSGITYGYDNTLARYQQTYPDRTAMGTLRFKIVSLEAVGPAAYLMVGRWFLQRDTDDLDGHFTLLFRKIDQRWRIVKDHSSGN